MNDTLHMTAQAHNLLETYYQDGDNAFHYDALKADDSVFSEDYILSKFTDN